MGFSDEHVPPRRERRGDVLEVHRRRRRDDHRPHRRVGEHRVEPFVRLQPPRFGDRPPGRRGVGHRHRPRVL
jgi:hypothetical protein